MRRKRFCLSAGLLIGLAACQSVPQDDNSAVQYMKGIPPSSDALVSDDISWTRDPAKATWTYQNVSQIHTGEFISKGIATPSLLPNSDASISDVMFADVDGTKRTFFELSERIKSNGVIILRDGEIIAEHYYGAFGPEDRHQLNSLTKAFIGTLVGALVSDGTLDVAAPFDAKFPELKESGAAKATLQNALDMALGLEWTMDWSDPESFRLQSFQAGGFIARPEGFKYSNTLELIADAPQQQLPGEEFAYQSASSELLGWSVSRATGAPWQHELSKRIWSRLGAERDAFVITDPAGHGFAAAGMSATLRDIARFGLMLEANGYYNEQQIVPADWIQNTIRGNSAVRDAMTSEREINSYGERIFYHNHFRILNAEEGEFFATGGGGQKLYINQKHNLVGVFLSNNPHRPDIVHHIDMMHQIIDYFANES